MQHYTKINPSTEIKAAGDNILYGAAQYTTLALVRDMDDVCRKAKLSVLLVPGLKSNVFSIEATVHVPGKDRYQQERFIP